MFSIVQKNSVTFLQAPNFLDFNFLTHAFCTRRGGVSQGAFSSLNLTATQGEEAERVEENWKILSRSFNIPVKSFLVLDQVHKDEVLVVREDPGPAPDRPVPVCDACVTQLPEVALCIRTADCVPVFLLDPHRRVVGAIHARWGGTALQITAKVIDVMIREFQCRPAEILAAIGPSIGPCCYEVDRRVYLAMRHHAGSEKFFRTASRSEKWNLDLPLANLHQLLEKGARRENIASSGQCTFCNPDLFFSHRRDRGKTGRHVNFIMLKKS
ncbi:MAG: Laccase domain protein YfiH [Syntrophus sp. PtaU1.Bin208]|nr:MAG: Laccase domain protein YfiH [Syntrophus sp. PtaU1.Bin208]